MSVKTIKAETVGNFPAFLSSQKSKKNKKSCFGGKVVRLKESY